MKALTAGLKTKVDDFTKKHLEGSSTVSETDQRRAAGRKRPMSGAAWTHAVTGLWLSVHSLPTHVVTGQSGSLLSSVLRGHESVRTRAAVSGRCSTPHRCPCGDVPDDGCPDPAATRSGQGTGEAGSRALRADVRGSAASGCNTAPRTFRGLI